MLDSIHAALRSGDAAAAESAARDALQQQPDSPDLHHLLGVALGAAGKPTEALESIDRAIELAPENAGFHVSRAFVLEREGDVETARRDLGAAVGIDPNSLGAYLTLARIEAAAGNLPAAEAQLRLAQRVAPQLPATRLVEGQLQLARNEIDAALASFIAASQGAPQDPLPQVCLAITYLRRGLPDVAEQALHNALRLRPAARVPRQLLVQLLIRERRWGEAVMALKPLIDAAPTDPALWHTLALVQIERRDLLAAVGALQHALRIDPNQPKTLALLQNIWAAREARAESRAVLDDLLTHHPGNAALWHARYAVDAARPQGADVLERWAAALPDEIRLAEARAERAESEQREDAEALADEVLARDGDRPAAHMIKARAELLRDPAAALARLNRLRERIDQPQLRAACTGLAGLAQDHLSSPAEAVASWCAMWALPGAGAELPEFGNTRSILRPTAERSPERLLWTLPGSLADSTVRAIGQTALIATGVVGTTARSADAPRPDQTPASPQPQLDPGETRPLVDWLPFVDDDLLDALPEARLLVLLDDPRDLLLNWLAFGSPQRHGLPRPEQGAEWLAAAFDWILDRQDRHPQRIRILRGAELHADAAAALAPAAEFLQIAPPPGGSWKAPRGPGSLPLAFEPGHWRNYSDALATAFARLDDVAERLQAQPAA